MTKDEALKQRLGMAQPNRGSVGFQEALAQPEQEPVAWGMEQSDGEILDVIAPEEHARLEGGYTVPLYRHPQRTWVGLTEDEAFACQGRDYFETYKAIEAKLKEKNT
jgi:hypothetical protein